MRDIPPRAAEEQLLWVQVTPYHQHNSVNLPRHLLHSTLHLLLTGDGLGLSGGQPVAHAPHAAH